MNTVNTDLCFETTWDKLSSLWHRFLAVLLGVLLSRLDLSLRQLRRRRFAVGSCLLGARMCPPFAKGVWFQASSTPSCAINILKEHRFGLKMIKYWANIEYNVYNIHSLRWFWRCFGFCFSFTLSLDRCPMLRGSCAAAGTFLGAGGTSPGCGPLATV